MIITLCNQKGGSGKTTTAMAIADGARLRGKKTLIVDCDPQANLTYSMGGNENDVGAYELLTGETTPGQTIQKTKRGDIIASSESLALADTSTDIDGVYGLRNVLKPIKGKYDVIVIDTPPTLGTLLINALAASDLVILPLAADVWALQGLYRTLENIKTVQAKYNKGLKVGGVLFTRHSTRTVLARDFEQAIRQKCKEMQVPVFKITIRDGISVREAQAEQANLFKYAPKSNPAIDYSKFLDELGL